MKQQVQKVKDKAQAIVDSISTDKVIAEAKLANAAPALKAAEDALQTIKSAHIATGKLYTNIHTLRQGDRWSQACQRCPCSKGSWGRSSDH